MAPRASEKVRTMSFEIGGLTLNQKPGTDEAREDLKRQIRKQFDRIKIMSYEIIKHKQEKLDYLFEEISKINEATSGKPEQENSEFDELREGYYAEIMQAMPYVEPVFVNRFENKLANLETGLSELDNCSLDKLTQILKTYKEVKKDAETKFYENAEKAPPETRSLSELDTLYKKRLEDMRNQADAGNLTVEQASDEEMEEMGQAIAALVSLRVEG